MSLPKPYFEEDGIVIYNADCREVLPYLPKVDLVFTSPPYNLGGAPWPHLGNWKPARYRGELAEERAFRSRRRRIKRAIPARAMVEAASERNGGLGPIRSALCGWLGHGFLRALLHQTREDTR